MANIQQIAERIFRHVEVGHLPAGYALTMGALIDAYGMPLQGAFLPGASLPGASRLQGSFPVQVANLPERDEGPDCRSHEFHDWANRVPDSAIEILIARMVRKGAWNDTGWLREYIQELSHRESAA